MSAKNSHSPKIEVNESEKTISVMPGKRSFVSRLFVYSDIVQQKIFPPGEHERIVQRSELQQMDSSE